MSRAGPRPVWRAAGAALAVVSLGLLAGCDTYFTRNYHRTVSTNVPAGVPASFRVIYGSAWQEARGSVDASGVVRCSSEWAVCNFSSDIAPDGTVSLFGRFSEQVSGIREAYQIAAPTALSVNFEGHEPALSGCSSAVLSSDRSPRPYLSYHTHLERSITCDPLLPQLTTTAAPVVTEVDGETSLLAGQRRLDIDVSADFQVEVAIVTRPRWMSGAVRSNLACPLPGRLGGSAIAGESIDGGAVVAQQYLIDALQLPVDDPWADVYVRVLGAWPYGGTGLAVSLRDGASGVRVAIAETNVTPTADTRWFHALRVPLADSLSAEVVGTFVQRASMPACAAEAVRIVAVRGEPALQAIATGADATVRVEFSEPVSGAAGATLRLETGSVDAIASDSAATATSNFAQLRFLVAAAMRATRLDVVSRDALQLPIGWATADGRPIDMTLPEPGAAASLAVTSDVRINSP